MKFKKLAGIASPYMLGLVAGVAIVSTTMANKAALKNEQYQKQYLALQQQNINKLNNSLKAVYATDSTADGSFTQAKLNQYLYTNIFDINSNVVTNQVGSTVGEKITLVGKDSNLNAQNKLSTATADNALKQDLTNTNAFIFNEKNFRENQIRQSYVNMQSQAASIYNDIIGVKSYIFSDSIKHTFTDAWGRNFTYNKIDKNHAELSFNLPWATSTIKKLPISLPSVILPPYPSIQQAKLQANDAAANDNFGNVVAISGDTAVVSAFQNRTDGAGAVYVYTVNNGTWSQQQKLVASNETDQNRFGISIDIDGDTIVVGADHEDTGGTDAGSAYVFTRSGNTWNQQQILQASNKGAGDEFGRSVSISGDTIVVGADHEDDGATNTGAAYVFTRSDSLWSQQQILRADDRAAEDNYGFELKIDNNTIAVGAYGDDPAGSVYIYTKNNGTWSLEQKIQVNSLAAGANMGIGIALDYNTLILGAHYDDSTATKTGSAYVFTRNNGNWTQQQKIVPSDIATNNRFGFSVALDNNIAIIGSPKESLSASSSGAAYVYIKKGKNWSEYAKLKANDEQADDEFGRYVGIYTSTALIGAPFEDTGGSNAGAAYIFVPE